MSLLVLPFIELLEVPVAGVVGQGVAGVGREHDQLLVGERVRTFRRIATLLGNKQVQHSQKR